MPVKSPISTMKTKVGVRTIPAESLPRRGAPLVMLQRRTRSRGGPGRRETGTTRYCFVFLSGDHGLGGLRPPPARPIRWTSGKT